MPVDPNNFLHSLALVIAAASGIAYNVSPPTSRGLWINKVIEDYALDPYSVLNPYPGSARGWSNTDSMAVQCMTTAKEDGAGLAQAWKIYNTLFDGDGFPLRMKAIAGTKTDGSDDAGYVILGVDPLQVPGKIGREDRGRAKFSFNFNLGFFQNPA